MLILVSISALLAFPIAWHYTDLNAALIISPLLIAAAAGIIWTARGTAFAHLQSILFDLQ